ncbi:glycoside hydrolase family 53 protein [Paenibacillus sp. FA6]|uniref:glycoside hydrolase family 53 protein n=1 Tax=Paenibacillus sp. FA6 TaxID=3413029 RepID=UPI003F65E319
MNSLFIKGMDISFLDEIEQSGGQFYDGNTLMDGLELFQHKGTNSIRLRIWNNPSGGYCNLERTLALAKRIKDKGLHFLLDFHYSDEWADPAHQTKPKAWEGLGLQELNVAVYRYTAEVLLALKEQGTLPDMVQIGNEITPGMLWDEGKVDGEWDRDEQWEIFTRLVKSGIRAARDVYPEVQIMIHIDRGGDAVASQYFYDRFQQYGVEYDIIGLSFYPWWHGTLDDLRLNLEGLANKYDKDIIVVEIAYPWTLDAPEGFPLIVNDEAQLHPGYPATKDGQAQYIRDIVQLIREVPCGKGKGFYYWEPCWTPNKAEWSVGHANNWSNLTLVDYGGRVLPALEYLK